MSANLMSSDLRSSDLRSSDLRSSDLRSLDLRRPHLIKRAAWLDRSRRHCAPREVAQDRLELIATMEGNHPAGQVEIFHALEPCLLHQLLQFLLRRMHANGLDHIAIAVAILGNKAAHRLEQIERVGVIQPLQRLPYFGKLQHHDTSARAQHTQHFFQCAVLVRHIPEAERNADAIKIIAGKWQLFGIALGYWHSSALIQ